MYNERSSGFYLAVTALVIVAILGVAGIIAWGANQQAQRTQELQKACIDKGGIWTWSPDSCVFSKVAA